MLWFFKANGDTIGIWVKSLFSTVILVSLVSVSYTAFFSDQFRLYNSSYRIGDATTTRISVGTEEVTIVPTSILHVFFGIGGSIDTWNKRRGYSQRWWRPNSTRGYVWFDKDPPDGIWKRPGKEDPPYRISEDAFRFGPRVSAARLARILSETYKLLVVNNIMDVGWIVTGDDDTVFFTENLVTVMGKYDHREMYYVGSSSETVKQADSHSFEMAYGGAGIAVSLPLAKEISEILDGCLLRYWRFYGSDQRIHACLIELGIPLTRESGFHQMDIRGDPYGVLAAHPIAPLVSLHHLDKLKLIFPESKTQVVVGILFEEFCRTVGDTHVYRLTSSVVAVKKLIEVSYDDPSRTLQQTICYESRQNWSVSVSWGYTVQIYTTVIPPGNLMKPLQTFYTWTGYANGPFNFNTRSLGYDPCQRPLVFFLDKTDNSGILKNMTTTIYKKNVLVSKDVRVCKLREHVEASKVERVTVVAPLMDPNDWKKAPRRQCCHARRKGTKMHIRIRKCMPEETSYPL